MAERLESDRFHRGIENSARVGSVAVLNTQHYKTKNLILTKYIDDMGYNLPTNV